MPRTPPPTRTSLAPVGTVPNHPAWTIGHLTRDEVSCARRTFTWVRDEIQHSVDFRRDEVTCRASDVLAARTGFCYSKSHLLAALL